MTNLGRNLGHNHWVGFATLLKVIAVMRQFDTFGYRASFMDSISLQIPRNSRVNFRIWSKIATLEFKSSLWSFTLMMIFDGSNRGWSLIGRIGLDLSLFDLELSLREPTLIFNQISSIAQVIMFHMFN